MNVLVMIISIVFVGLTPVQSQTIETRSDAASISTAGTSIGRQDAWSLRNNPGIFTSSRDLSIGVSYKNHYFLNQLGQHDIAISVPSNKVAFSGYYSGLGFGDYRQLRAGLAHNMRLSERWSSGVQFDYYQVSVENYARTGSFSFGLGAGYAVNNQLLLGLHLYNESLSTNNWSARMGSGWNVSDVVTILSEVETSVSNQWKWRVGVDYEVVNSLNIRFGYSSELDKIPFGIGYEIKAVRINVSGEFHRKLGYSTALSLIYSYNKRRGNDE